MKNKNFTFLVPSYNCESFIYKNSLKLIRKINKSKISYKITFINDASSDNTLKELKRVKSKFKNISIISCKKNLGKSFAIRQGLKLAKSNYIILIDCDLPYFEKLILLIKKLN